MTTNLLPIVVAVDGSHESRQALEVAIEEAGFRETTLHVVSVIDISPAVLHLPDDQRVNTAEIAESKHEEIWGQIEDVDTGSVTIEQVGLTGTPSAEISRYCEEIDAALLVVGNRGRGRVKGAFLGSTSKRLLEKAHCPVLIVK